jgi:hypothetical protein
MFIATGYLIGVFTQVHIHSLKGQFSGQRKTQQPEYLTCQSPPFWGPSSNWTENRGKTTTVAVSFDADSLQAQPDKIRLASALLH